MNQQENYINSLLFEFERYKTLGDNTFSQLNDQDLNLTYNQGDNSISLIVKHITGNMISRWTHFLTEDGEKSWRDRESEFTDSYSTKTEMINAWEQGWECLFSAVASVRGSNFDTLIKIRNEEHTIIEAMNRQLAHYAYHIGQIVHLGKMHKGDKWISLSIPKGGSKAFNKEKISK